MQIKSFLAGDLGTNCYLMINEEEKRAVLVDPAACSQELKDFVNVQGLRVEAILLTHAHFDHIMGIDDALTAFGKMPVYVHEADQEMLESAAVNLSAAYGINYSFRGAETLRDGQVLHLAGTSVQVLHTPGHTPGGVCYYLEEFGVLISGDTLFQESVGRTDFPGGSMSRLVRSIRSKLFVLPDETKVYPGHMGSTTIGHEKRYNPFL